MRFVLSIFSAGNSDKGKTFSTTIQSELSPDAFGCCRLSECLSHGDETRTCRGSSRNFRSCLRGPASCRTQFSHTILSHLLVFTQQSSRSIGSHTSQLLYTALVLQNSRKRVFWISSFYTQVDPSTLFGEQLRPHAILQCLGSICLVASIPRHSVTAEPCAVVLALHYYLPLPVTSKAVILIDTPAA